MEAFLEFIKTDNFILWSAIINIILILVVLILISVVISSNKKYLRFMKKLGKEKN